MDSQLMIRDEKACLLLGLLWYRLVVFIDGTLIVIQADSIYNHGLSNQIWLMKIKTNNKQKTQPRGSTWIEQTSLPRQIITFMLPANPILICQGAHHSF